MVFTCWTLGELTGWVDTKWRQYKETKLKVKVPELTIYFWIIKILSTTIGESFADYLSDTVGLGEVKTLWIMGSIFLVIWAIQIACTEYVPVVYWTVIVLISVVGTLFTDNLVDNAGLMLWETIIMWALLLSSTFSLWYWSERSLSIHSIYTRKRELFYWFAILFTFALGTGVGDQFSEGLGIGYWESALVFFGAIAIDYMAYLFVRLNSVLAFWIAYVLTRPLGASIGDFLSQPTDTKGLGLGPGITSAIFAGLIIACVTYLTITKKDVIKITENQIELQSNDDVKGLVAHDPECGGHVGHEGTMMLAAPSQQSRTSKAMAEPAVPSNGSVSNPVFLPGATA